MGRHGETPVIQESRLGPAQTPDEDNQQIVNQETGNQAVVGARGEQTHHDEEAVAGRRMAIFHLPGYPELRMVVNYPLKCIVTTTRTGIDLQPSLKFPPTITLYAATECATVYQTCRQWAHAQSVDVYTIRIYDATGRRVPDTSLNIISYLLTCSDLYKQSVARLRDHRRPSTMGGSPSSLQARTL